jgi:hypothetical protein
MEQRDRAVEAVIRAFTALSDAAADLRLAVAIAPAKTALAADIELLSRSVDDQAAMLLETIGRHR